MKYSCQYQYVSRGKNKDSDLPSGSIWGSSACSFFSQPKVQTAQNTVGNKNISKGHTTIWNLLFIENRTDPKSENHRPAQIHFWHPYISKGFKPAQISRRYFLSTETVSFIPLYGIFSWWAVYLENRNSIEATLGIRSFQLEHKKETTNIKYKRKTSDG